MSNTARTSGAVWALAVAVGLAILAYGGGNLLVLAVAPILTAFGVEFTPRVMILLSVLAIQLVAFVSVSIGYLQYRGMSISDIGIEMPTLEDWIALGAGLVGVIVLWLLASVATVLVSMRFGIEQPEQEIIRLGQQDPMVFVLLAILSILVVGPAEELLFRGIIQTRLRETFGVASGLTLATAVFALIHLPGFVDGTVLSALLGVSVLFVIGAVLAVIYEYTGNLVVVAILHGLFNAAQGALGYFSVQFAPEEAATVQLLLLAVA